MPVETLVLPHRNLAVFLYTGLVTFEEVRAAVAQVARAPQHHDTMRHFCDLTGISGLEPGLVDVMKLMAQITEDLVPRRDERLVVFLAPHAMARSVAELARKSWENNEKVLVRVVEREEQAMALFGFAQMRLSELTARQV